jgi:hypothetical protein
VRSSRPTRQSGIGLFGESASPLHPVFLGLIVAAVVGTEFASHADPVHARRGG